MKNNDTYKKFVIEKAIKGKYSNRKASIQLDLSIRQIQRLKKRYKEEKDISHKNRGRIPINKISKEKETEILNLYKSKYCDFNFRHFIDCLEEYEKMTVSYNLVYRILIKNGFSSPKHHKKRGKENIHPLRERRKHLGELIQIDASIHNWFGDDLPKAALHGAVDDATGIITGLYFDENETLKGYYNMLNQILTNHGIPEAFYGDNRTIFEFQKKRLPDTENTHIQFKRCCNQLGIELITTSVSQAKGRIERLWNTLQSRLLAELRLNNIKDIESANKFLPSFIKRYNAKFKVEPISNESYFVKAPKLSDINLYLSIVVDRKILTGSIFKYKTHTFQCVDYKDNVVKLKEGEVIKVIETFDERIMVEYNGEIFDCRNIEFKPKDTHYIKKGRRTIPPGPNHPWKKYFAVEIEKKKNKGVT